MKYKAGDRVRVREWDDMAREFGVDGTDHINCSFGFVLSMRKYCGNIVTIQKASSTGYEIEEDEEGWRWSDDMFEMPKNVCKSFKNIKIEITMAEAFRVLKEYYGCDVVIKEG